MLIVIFSKDRAMQLDACINSLFANCEGLNYGDLIKVLYKTSNELHEKSYNILIEEHKNVSFVKEDHFKDDLVKIVLGSLQGIILFVTDDTIFTKKFSKLDIREALVENPSALGISLRLGLNTTYCYMQNKQQNLPQVEHVFGDIYKYKWFGKDKDFGYPLEVSSSAYSVGKMMLLLMNKHYNNPNSFESAMFTTLDFYSNTSEDLLMYKTSRAFSNPCNIVQNKKTNRHGNTDVDDLVNDFLDGKRIDIRKYKNMTTNSVHQEEPLYYI